MFLFLSFVTTISSICSGVLISPSIFRVYLNLSFLTVPPVWKILFSFIAETTSFKLAPMFFIFSGSISTEISSSFPPLISTLAIPSTCSNLGLIMNSAVSLRFFIFIVLLFNIVVIIGDEDGSHSSMIGASQSSGSILLISSIFSLV